MKLNKVLLFFALLNTPIVAVAGSYTPTTWIDDSPPAINAAQLNRIEAGVDSAHSELDANDIRIDGKEDALDCSDTQIKKWSGGLWVCATDEIGAGDIEGVTAGTGLTGGGTSGTVTINADPTYLQRRVSSTCAEGSSIRIIAEDGTVTCETDDSGSGSVPSGTVDGQMLIWDQTTTQAWIVVSELDNIRFLMGSDEASLLWSTGPEVTYKAHLDEIFEPLDPAIAKTNEATYFTQPVTAPIKVVSKSGTVTLTAEECSNTLITVTAAGTFILPTAATGLACCLSNATALTATLSLAPAALDYLSKEGVAGTVATARVATSTLGNDICVVAEDDTYWKIRSEVGTWSE